MQKKFYMMLKELNLFNLKQSMLYDIRLFKKLLKAMKRPENKGATNENGSRYSILQSNR